MGSPGVLGGSFARDFQTSWPIPFLEVSMSLCIAFSGPSSRFSPFVSVSFSLLLSVSHLFCLSARQGWDGGWLCMWGVCVPIGIAACVWTGVLSDQFWTSSRDTFIAYICECASWKLRPDSFRGVGSDSAAATVLWHMGPREAFGGCVQVQVLWGLGPRGPG